MTNARRMLQDRSAAHGRLAAAAAAALAALAVACDRVGLTTAAPVTYRIRVTSGGTRFSLPIAVTDVPGGRVPLPPLLLKLEIEPATATAPAIAWSATAGARVSVEPGAGNFGGPTAPNEIYLSRGSALGPFAVTARVGPPVNRSITVPAFGYARGSVGCGTTGADGLVYDRLGRPRAADRPVTADIYATGPDYRHQPPMRFDSCSGAFVRNGERFVIHVPGGAVGFDAGIRRFPTLGANDYRPPFRTSFARDDVPDFLLFRLRDGRLAKTAFSGEVGEPIAGSTLVSRADGTFADAAFGKSVRPSQDTEPERRAARTRYEASIDLTGVPADANAAGRAIELTLSPSSYAIPRPIHVAIVPTPDGSPDVLWSGTGRGPFVLEDHGTMSADWKGPPGTATLIATVGPPVDRVVRRAVRAYAGLHLSATGAPPAAREAQPQMASTAPSTTTP